MCEKKQMEWQEREGTRLRLREGVCVCVWRGGGAGGKERVTERPPVVVCGREQAQRRRQVCTFNATFSACRGQDKAEKGEGQVRRCARESAHTWRCIRAGGETATSARCGTRESAAFTNVVGSHAPFKGIRTNWCIWCPGQAERDRPRTVRRSAERHARLCVCAGERGKRSKRQRACVRVESSRPALPPRCWGCSMRHILLQHTTPRCGRNVRVN